MSRSVPAFAEGRYIGPRLCRALALLLALGCLTGGALMPSPGRAHAMLVETVPQDGAVLANAPSAIVLRFNEAVRPIAIRVLDQDGRAISTPGRIEAADRELRLALPVPLPDGRYLVSYRVTSADSHPISGAFLFIVGTPRAGPMPVAAPAEAADEIVWRIAAVLNQIVHFAALLIAAGGTLFLLLAAPQAARDRMRAGFIVAAAIGAVTAILGVGLQGGVLAGSPLSTLFEATPWRIGATTTVGSSAAAAVAGLALLAAGLSIRRSLLGSGTAAAGALFAIASLVMTGHAAATEPRWLAVPAWGLHSLTVAFWLGAFWPLLVILREQPPDIALPVVHRFSRLAVPAVGLLVAMGLLIAALQLRSVAALFGTGYGRLLLLKLGGVALLMLIAAYNRQRLTPALAAGDKAAPHRLRRAIRAEIGVAALILAATVLLGQTVPPHALGPQAHAAHGASATAKAGGIIARVAVEPAVGGRNRVTLALTGADGQPVTPLEVSVALSLPEAGVEPIVRTPIAIGSGRYRLSGPEFFLAGRWTIRIEALITDFEKVTLTAEVPIR